MSRFSGRQARNAARDLRAVRRTEAEQRQAAEAARDEARAAARASQRPPPNWPLSDGDVADLTAAIRALAAARLQDDLNRLQHQPEGQQP